MFFLDLTVNLIFSVCVFFITVNTIPKVIKVFLNASLFGIDVNKATGDKLPEAMGVVAGCIYLIFMFLYIPVPFSDAFLVEKNFPHNEFVEMIAALLSICCMLLLGFADDILDLRWKHKLILPTIASLPLLMVYYVNFNSTTVIIPKILRSLIGYSVNLGFLYYVYMGMLAVFCTNAINILAGVNGLEVGQSIIIAISIALLNFIELFGDHYKAHRLSLQFILPYIANSIALLKYNWYPAKIFVGDTFCYFSGMTFAVVGILGHFSKTMLLFFIPQVFNFLYSLPQLFKFIPCPRHRMPRLNKNTGLLEPSVTIINNSDSMNSILKLFIRLLSGLKLLQVKNDGNSLIINNMTLINLLLVWMGPLHEAKLTTYLIIVQVICSCIAFTIRYPLAFLFYDHIG
ncbi:UDP-N-acetylglucosamine--dolichyl-phosphate N-acetylglucosaminephosphotransferase, putative [Pediculus humanus corporis]|uniref:UDP-N-acetylglucosamine--dolichyl-phosphate N-acetylglucosaminephosphotransferase n=1 Tax=Pediculus humanus subsp. corporis TaxID=121224 RepID=E0W3S4_PEDHC|nr:UDP-N-acetylglucosamine--dolichyl-phosphate N-acetylglucosaminephosphotransferase, putative [Pediculus humanus corporis]EEB20281.1 UDP-N-acetylglucosamine--dolichyl-phosphate N-acetylglucosaminephosphotransferase, putative [Pediculus humanus corporis]